MGVENVKLRIDSQLVIYQVKGKLHSNDPLLYWYLMLNKEKFVKIKMYEVVHVLREQITRVGVLSKLVSTRGYEVNHYIIQEAIKNLSIETLKDTVVVIDGTGQSSWISPITSYIEQAVFLLIMLKPLWWNEEQLCIPWLKELCTEEAFLPLY